MDFLGNLHEHGVFLRRDAIALGADQKAIRLALRDGSIARVRHGAYVRAERWRDADAVARHVLRAHAVGLSHGRPFMISHLSGALMHGMRSWNVDLDRVHVSREPETGGLRTRDIAYHQRVIDECVEVDGTPVSPAASCAVEAACLVGVEEGVVIVDSALHQGLCTQDELRSAYAERLNWPGTARLRITLSLAQPGSESVGESRLRFLFWTLGIPRPVLQFPIEAEGRVIAFADFGWPAHRLLDEFDGRVKYEQFVREGERASDAVVREKIREDRIREATGWRMIRFSWADLNKPAQVRDRMQRALNQAA
jgi:hypothetical protein